MLGGFILGVVAGGLAVWKWRDAIREYVKENAGPAITKADNLLGTVQQRSERLLDLAKERVASGLERTREKVRTTGGGDAGEGPTE
jgi:uncharacterized protein YgfB (UPF0149 family)